MTLYGWDASDYDWSRGTMDAAAAARDGISWFTHKASEGTSVRHMRYGEAMARFRDAGIPVLGAYHVVRSPANAAAEVDYHLHIVDAATPWWRDHPHWIFQVDLEKWPYEPVPASEGEQFADIIEALTGRPAIIYASAGQYGGQLAGSSHRLWNANYPTWTKTLGKAPATHFRQAYADSGGDTGPGWAKYSGQTPVFWQYTDNATIGTQRGCDANAFRGTREQLLALTASRKGPLMALTDDEQQEMLKILRALHLNGWDPTVTADGKVDGRGNSIKLADVQKYVLAGVGAYDKAPGDPAGPANGFYLDRLLKLIRDEVKASAGGTVDTLALAQHLEASEVFAANVASAILTQLRGLEVVSHIGGS